MKLSFRWYGADDKVTLENIRQIPKMEAIVTAVYDVPVGEVWSEKSIADLKKQVEENGLKFEVIESIPVHEDIKLGLPTRDRYIENYIKTINIEAKTMLSMMKKTFLPSVLSYCKELAETAAKTKAILPDAPISAESKLLEKLSYTEISEKTEALAEAEKAAESMEDNIEKVAYFHYTILAKMDDLRSSVDTAEALIPDSFLPYPTYDELLFSV